MLFIGAAENPFADPFEIRAARLGKKVKAGVEFIQTQCIYNMERFEKWMEMVRERGLHERCAVLAGVTPFKSVGMARYMKNSVPGMDVPDEMIERMKGVPKEKQIGGGDQDLCGDDPEVEGGPWGEGDSYYGDRVGGEGVGDCEGGRPSAETTSVKPHRA